MVYLECGLNTCYEHSKNFTLHYDVNNTFSCAFRWQSQMLFSSSLFGNIQLLQYTLKHHTSCVQNLTMGKLHLWSQFLDI